MGESRDTKTETSSPFPSHSLAPFGQVEVDISMKFIPAGLYTYQTDNVKEYPQISVFSLLSLQNVGHWRITRGVGTKQGVIKAVECMGFGTDSPPDI